MVQKRSFYDEELCSIPSKHPRQEEYNNQLVSFSEFVPPEVGSPTPHAPGESGLTENATEVHEWLASEIDARFPVSAEKGVDEIVPGRRLISYSNIGFNEEVSCPEIPVYISCPTEYFSPGRPFRAVTDHEDIYSLLLRYPPKKVVSIGSDHQADIPEWCPHDCKTRTKSSGSPGSVLDAHLVLEKDENRLMGTCVIPMPDFELADEVENVKIECCCPDEGSIRCVRQHIVDARDKLERTLGKERFEQLGFSLMGEQVAEKWSEKEEQLFHEVVFSNPVSQGKNFWNYLSALFPSRTTKDIVCYYFNVFMLRRRAEQNRCESVNIYDSDDDEWQASDYGDNELGMTEEDEEDSVVESPVCQDCCAHKQNQKYDNLHVCDEGVADDTSDNYAGFTSDRDVITSLETCPRISLDSCGFNHSHFLLDKFDSYGMADREVQDDSCKSNDTGVSSQGIHVKAETDAHWPCNSNGLSYGSDRDHVLEPSNVKVWDIGYTICPKLKVDFLPTCSMIEEVFGDGPWNHKASDDKSLS